MKTIQRLPAVLLFAATSALAANPQLQADRQAVNRACASDAAVAHCSGLPAGRGLGRCLQAFHRANPGYRFSPACKAAKRQLRFDRRAYRRPPV